MIRAEALSEHVSFDGSASLPSEGSGAPIIRYQWQARQGNPAPLRIRCEGPGDSCASARVILPRQDGEYYATLRVTDAQGRRDAVWGVKLRRPDFWPEWRGELKRTKPDLLLLAEASARGPYYFSHGFDVAYDWLMPTSATARPKTSLCSSSSASRGFRPESSSACLRGSRASSTGKLTDLLSGRQVPIRSAAPGRAGLVLPKLSAHLLVDEDAPVRLA